jgi:hypothetical protein
MKQENPDIFVEDYEKSYLFDGDTIEFMTQKFYKTKVQDVIDELSLVEKDFMRALNSLPREGILRTYGPFQIAKENYPFASYLTNLKNNAMFNNGTIHINITLPTQLDSNSEIADFELFRKQHQNYARAIQWISPLLVAKYGAHDPLCESKTNGLRYSAGSQRVAVSRYIGLGTYDTDKMEVGKILTRSRDLLENIDWYKSFHEKVDYKFLNEMGMDINFNKHFCHGIEFRILESIPMDDLYDVLLLMVYLADFSLDVTVTNPKRSQLWNRVVENCVHNGKGYFIDVSDQNELYTLFGLSHLSKEPLPAADVLNIIVEFLSEKYKNGLCAQYMIQGEDYAVKPINTTQTEKALPAPSVTSLSGLVPSLKGITQLEPIIEVLTPDSNSSRESIHNSSPIETLVPEFVLPTPTPVLSIPEVKLKKKSIMCC